MLKDNIKKFRNINNLTQDELANKLFVSRTLVTKWETGNSLPTKDNIYRMCELFKISTNKLLNRKEYKQIMLGSYKTKIIEKILILSTLIIFIISITLFVFSFILENTLSSFSNIRIIVPTTRITALMLIVLSFIILIIEIVIRQRFKKEYLNEYIWGELWR